MLLVSDAWVEHLSGLTKPELRNLSLDRSAGLIESLVSVGQTPLPQGTPHNDRDGNKDFELTGKQYNKVIGGGQAYGDSECSEDTKGIGLLGFDGLGLKGLWLQGMWLQSLGFEGVGFEGLWLEGLWLEGLWLEGLGFEGLWLEGL